jgi:signal peptidase II
LQRWGIVLVIAGALGNAIDRVVHGAVVDFLDFHVAGWHWPAFNVADSSIVVGAALLILDGLWTEKPTST